MNLFFSIIDERDKERFRVFSHTLDVEILNFIINEKKSRYPIWGLFPTVKQELWNQIKKNDMILFGQADSGFTEFGIVNKKIQNKKFAAKIWPNDIRAAKIEQFIVLNKLNKTSIGFNEFLRKIGYSGDKILPGFYPVKSEISNYIMSDYSTIAKIIEPKSSLKPIRIPADYDEAPDKKSGNVVRFIRETSKAKILKKKYENKCQVCQFRFEISAGKFYSEVHHIFPLKEGGPDNFNNMLVLCPNHHAEFDYNVLGIAEDGKSVINRKGEKIGDIKIQNDHNLDKNNLRFQFSRT